MMSGSRLLPKPTLTQPMSVSMEGPRVRVLRIWHAKRDQIKAQDIDV